MNLMERISAIMRDVFVDPDLVIDRETTAADVPGWDSLSHIRLLMTIEKKLSLRFDPADVSKPKNVGELVDLIAKKTGR